MKKRKERPDLLPLSAEGKSYILFNLAHTYLAVSDYDKAEEVFWSAVRNAEKNNGQKTKEYAASSLFYIGHIYSIKRDIETARKCMKRSTHLADSIGYSEIYVKNIIADAMIDLDLGEYALSLGKIEALMKRKDVRHDEQNILKVFNAKATVLLWKGEPKRALPIFLRALKMSESSGDRYFRSALYDNIGQTYSDLGQYKKALEYYFLAVRTDESSGNQSGLISEYTNIGVVYKFLNDPKTALIYLKKAMNIVRRTGHLKTEHILYCNIGSILYDLGKIEEARGIIEKALALARKVGDKNTEGINLGNLAGVLAKCGDMKGALDCHLKAMKLHKKIDFKQGLAYDLINVAEILKSNGDLKGSLEYYREARSLIEKYGVVAPDYDVNRLTEIMKEISKMT